MELIKIEQNGDRKKDFSSRLISPPINYFSEQAAILSS